MAGHINCLIDLRELSLHAGKLQSQWITKVESSQTLLTTEFHHIIERPFTIETGS
nr:hypothetical protein [uncultured Prevotella sp.]